MTIRLSHSSFTGTDLTLVAVGTVSEESMFCTVRAGAPRRTVYVAWSLAWARSDGFGSFGTGLVVPFAGSAALASGRGLATGAGAAAFVSLVEEGALAVSLVVEGALAPVTRPGDVLDDGWGAAGAGAGAGAGLVAVVVVVPWSDA